MSLPVAGVFRSAWLVLLLSAALASCAKDAPVPPGDVAGQSWAAFRAGVVKAIPDPARAATAAGLVDEMQSEFEQGRRDSDEHRKRLTAMNADYDAKPDDFHELFAAINERRVLRQQRAASIRARLVAVTTDDEWQQLGKLRQRVLEAEMAAR